MTTSNSSPHAIRIRLSILIGVFALTGVGMLGRAIQIQIVGDPKLAHLASRQFQSKVHMKPRRGLILDRTGEPLAINLETSSLAGNPQKILKTHSTQILLARALGMPVSALKKKLDSKKVFTWFERHITDERMDRFRRTGIVLSTGEMPEGLWIVKEMKRVYPHGELARPIVGSVNIDTIGIEGIELWKEGQLKGKGVQLNAIKDALGRPALIQAGQTGKMQDGESISLSIDASLQYSIEEALEESMVHTKAAQGLVVVMDAETGEILASAQSPVGGKVKKLKMLTDGYEPGSTFKAISLAMALEKNVLKFSDSLFGHYGKFTLQGRTISEAESHERFGMINMKKMIEVSSNIVAAELALKMGAEKMVLGLKHFGYGQKSGIDFPGEISGWVPQTSKNLKPLTLANIGFGQGILVTPLQMLRAYAAIANGGFLVQPTIFKVNDPKEIKRAPLLRPQVAEEVTEALLAVTEGSSGTGKKARLEGFRVAGKTGTAQTVDPVTKRYSQNHYLASFIGFPVNVKQKVVILSLLDHPKGIYYASETAAPLFSRVLEATVNRFSIPATEKLVPVLTQSETPTPTPSEVEQIQVVRSSLEEVHPDFPVMPSLIGLTPQEAMKVLKQFEPKIHLQGFGVIRKQIPNVGENLEHRTKVTLILGE